MPFLKVWVHLIWATKNREPLLNSSIRQQVFQHTLLKSREKGIYIDTMNGFDDHAHCLVSLSHSQTLAAVAHQIKGESAHWINELQLIEGGFNWQEEYFAASVSESNVQVVRKYIQNQEKHHLKKTFKDECDELKEKYGFSFKLD